jgi:DNA-binding NtrC family response regulator
MNDAPAASAPPGSPTLTGRLLLCDDEESMRYYLGRSLRRHGLEVEAVDRGQAAIDVYARGGFDAVVLDLKMPGMDGLEVLSRIRELDPEAMVILMTAHGTIPSTVEAMKRGAFHYITKPFENEELLLLVERALTQRATLRENRNLRQLVEHRTDYGGLIGQSSAMQAVFQQLDLLCKSPATVLITGESGTGKELVARALHVHSGRAGEFIAVNCGALPETLFENELFGHEPGAFTGATKKTRGLIERADRGSLFLDEVPEIPRPAQGKLLRFLQEREFTPLGSTDPVAADVRIIAATNQDLGARVGRGDFREDLYWSLNVVPVRLPALRERREDIPLLCAHFLERFTPAGTTKQTLSLDAQLVLSSYEWPGNVRELANTIERVTVLHADQQVLEVEHLPPTIQKDVSGRRGFLMERAMPYKDAQIAFERDYVEHLLRQTNGNVSQAAKLAGLSRTNIHRKIEQLGLSPERFRRDG